TPEIVVILFFGILLGPNSFNLIDRCPAIELFGTIGLLYLMFLAGIEVDMHQFNRSKKKSGVFGFLTFIIPEVLGSVIAVYVLGFNWITAILLASMYSSHTLLAYPVASKLGITKSEHVTITVGGTMITDFAALMVLTIIRDITISTITPMYWINFVILLSFFTFVLFYIVPFISNYFFRHSSSSGSTQYIFVLSVLFGSGALAHAVGLEPIIGAFMAGLALNKLIPEQSPLMNRINFIGNTIFIPFLLISVGMIVDPVTLFFNPKAWLVAAVMVISVIITKFAAAYVTQKLFGYSKEEKFVIFGLSVVQAAATLAAVMIGFNIGIFDEAVLNGTIMMILVTCIIGPWFVEKYGKKYVYKTSDVQQKRIESEHQNILVSVLNPKNAEILTELGIYLRNPEKPGVVNVLSVITETGNYNNQLNFSEKMLAKCVIKGTESDIKVKPVIRLDLSFVDGITRTAVEKHSDTLIIGWGGKRNTGDNLFGNILDNLLEEVVSKIMVCRFVKPLLTTKKVVIILPPESFRESDFDLIIRDIQKLSKIFGVYLNIITTEKQSKIIKRIIDSNKDIFVETEYETYDNWDFLSKNIFVKRDEDDLIVFFSARPDTLTWNSSFETLPFKLSKYFNKNNLMIVYPEIYNGNERVVSSNTQPKDYKNDFYFYEENQVKLDEFIEKLVLNSDIEIKSAQKDIVKSLRESLEKFPTEFMPGFLLVHCHSSKIKRNLIATLRLKEAVTVENVKNKVEVVIFLVSTTELGPNNHLVLLSGLANMFSNPKNIDVLKTGDFETLKNTYFSYLL
ncbi:MAG: cation:proton antiporter, partial [Spirochaetota bacterium]